MDPPRYLLVLSEADPVARAVGERWGTPPSTGEFVDGSPIRGLGPGIGTVRRPGLHIHDDSLDERLPTGWRSPDVPLLFPSVHRSESGTDCFTVHPLGNLTASNEVGGRPGELTPAPARLMAAALRALDEERGATGLETTFEATHHGPWLRQPGAFVEIGFAGAPAPPEAAVRALATRIPELVEDDRDSVVVGIGGGHYAPHFTELCLDRRWAFGHLVPRHALEQVGDSVIPVAFRATPGATGLLFARAGDVNEKRVAFAPRRREGEAARRERITGSAGAAPTSGT